MGFQQFDNMRTVTSAQGAAVAVTDLSTWASRPSASDGAWGVASTGVYYRYSTTVGDWVRPAIYSGTVTLDAHIVGTENSEGDLTGSTIGLAMTKSATATGTVSSDGTSCTISCTAGTGHYTWYATPTTLTNGAWSQGYSSISLSGAVHAGPILTGDSISNGAMVGGYSTTTTANIVFSNSGISTAHVYISNDLLSYTTERWVEMILYESATDPFLLVYIDHAALPNHAYRDPAWALGNKLVGVRTGRPFGSGTGTVVLRDFRGGSF